jgi:ABC-type Mn2+/Zn2+ transport system permease subunit
VFTSLIVPAVATYRHAKNRQLAFGYALGFGSYVVGLALSVITDLPSSPVIVWAMGVIGLFVHLTGKRTVAAENGVVANHQVRSGASG